jgi:DNA repair protein RecN (Recombination protein N)
MLTLLELRDFVLVDSAELALAPGLTALTGETGAGKSIVVDALLLIAGGRGGADVVRAGAERAEVTAIFADLPAPATAWLEEQAILHEGEVIVRRVIGADGRSRAYVNGQLLALSQLRDFMELLLQIHGQQEFQHLIKREAQRALLDDHVDDPALLSAVAAAANAARTCRGELDRLRAAAANRESRLDLLRYQLTELQAEVTTVNAIEELLVERNRLAGSGRLSEAARTALTAVYEADDQSAHDLLARASAALRPAAELDPDLAAAAQLLGEATILTREAANALQRYLDSLDLDPGRQDEVERHAAALESLARKHRIEVRDLPAQLAAIQAEIIELDRAESSLLELERQLAGLETAYHAAASRLTEARRRAAEALGANITALMQTLGMSGGRFSVSVTPGSAHLAPHGVDDIEFLVSANPGQPPKSLAKVASGGELSRISLAVQVSAAAKAAALCMVFDEVDAGIGGAIAEIVGRCLRDLGVRSQVLCVTHLAQVAAQAHTQFRVIKHSDGKATRTVVKPLDETHRIDEIARMLGGVDITDQARAHAREMLSGVLPKRRRAQSAVK